MDLNITKTAMNITQNYENFNATKFMFLKKYFEINNEYIYTKLKLLLFPFDNTLDYLYKPDLYIPFMSLISFALCRSLLYGFNSEFHPEKLFVTISRNIFIHLIFSLMYLFIGFLIGIKINILSLISFSGYKYVFIFIIKFLILIHLNIINYILGIYFLFVYFIFYSRSLKNEIFKTELNRSQLYFVFGTAVIETIIFLILILK